MSWCALVAGGGFIGTFGALQLTGPPTEAIGAEGVPIRVLSDPMASADRYKARCGLCVRGGGRDCVVDGDTFWFAGEKYRIADIDTPETHGPRCPAEANLATAATRRLHDWLNAGAFSLEHGARDSDRYDRKLRVVTRSGTSVGEVLIGEGLAREWAGARRSWC